MKEVRIRVLTQLILLSQHQAWYFLLKSLQLNISLTPWRINYMWISLQIKWKSPRFSHILPRWLWHIEKWFRVTHLNSIELCIMHKYQFFFTFLKLQLYIRQLQLLHIDPQNSLYPKKSCKMFSDHNPFAFISLAVLGGMDICFCSTGILKH